jgi:hypothetical protein
MAGIAPPIFQEKFKPFLNSIPPRSPEDVRAVVEAELGCKREEVFSEWEDKPIGCASIGQTHRAKLRKNGKSVVVKVQDPNAERTFRGDVFSIKVVVDTFQPQVRVFVFVFVFVCVFVCCVCMYVCLCVVGMCACLSVCVCACVCACVCVRGGRTREAALPHRECRWSQPAFSLVVIAIFPAPPLLLLRLC